MGRLLLRDDDERDAKLLFDAYTTALSESRVRRLVLDVLGVEDEDVGGFARGYANRFILAHYPNEATIKANFVKKALLRLDPGTVSIFELPIGKSRADICTVNGRSAVYEIKTDLDSFHRLEGQLSDYFDVFEAVHVITSERRWEELPGYVPAECGIYSYRQCKDGSYAFRCRRKAMANRDLDAEKQLMAMPKKSLCEALGLSRASLSKPSLVEQCLGRYSARQINRAFKEYLKRRYSPNWRHLKQNSSRICEIDYEWFYRYGLDPEIVY